MKYIIMCGGTYHAWKTPRQMTELNGEAIVARTIRLLRECGVDDIAISTHDDRYLRFGVPLLRHFNDFVGYVKGCGSWAEAFFPMDAPACYLMGDVVFSPELYGIIQETQGFLEDGKLHIGDNDLLKIHLLNSAIKMSTERGRGKLVKLSPSVHIDGTAALLDAMTVRQKYYGEIGAQLRN